MDQELKMIIEKYESEHPVESISNIDIENVKEESARLQFLCIKEEWLEVELERVRREADEIMDEIIRKTKI